MKTLTIFLASAVCVLGQTFQTQRMHLGDSPVFTIPLTWQGAAFAAGTDWALIWTAKSKATDTDAQALIQKTTGAGITASGNNAVVTLVRADTVNLYVGALVWDVQAAKVSTGEVRTVARGRLILERDVTQQTTTSIPVVTTEDPLPFGGGAATFAELTDKTTADLPGINSPLAAALAGKVSAGVSGDESEQDVWGFKFFKQTTFFEDGIQVTGSVSADSLDGDGSNITNLNANTFFGDMARARINSALRTVPASPVFVTTLEGFEETAAPAAPQFNGFTIYAEDNGSGKTRLMVRFNTGAPQQIAIQP